LHEHNNEHKHYFVNLVYWNLFCVLWPSAHTRVKSLVTDSAMLVDAVTRTRTHLARHVTTVSKAHIN